MARTSAKPQAIKVRLREWQAVWLDAEPKAGAQAHAQTPVSPLADQRGLTFCRD